MPSKVTLSTQGRERLDSILQHYTDNGSIPGIVAGAADKDRILYVGAAGVKDLAKPRNDPSNALNVETSFLLFSTTKAITITAVFQLFEKGLVDLNDPISKHIPNFGSIKVIKSIDEETGDMELEDVKTPPTIKNLTTHTAGFAYAFFNDKYRIIQEKKGKCNILSSKWEEFDVPMSNQPGTQWEYGSNIDFLGRIVEEVSGMALEEYFKKHIFEPLGCNTFKFNRTEQDLQNMASLHVRTNDKNGFQSLGLDFTPMNPEFYCGGHGLFGTVGDYLKFLQVFLNGGASPVTGKQILKKETIEEYAFKEQLSKIGDDIKVCALPGVQPQISNNADFYPGVPKNWSDFFLINEEQLSTGRSAGSLSWTGLANLYFFIDYKKGIVCYWAESVFPFFDDTTIKAFEQFESEVFKTFT